MTNGENQSIAVFEKHVGKISQLKKVCKLGEELQAAEKMENRNQKLSHGK